ncbi:cytochrome P450 [Daldinia decipiens]|uniref:cytochrome P450 n=1 Tax=Daldinia decipiens TaxID=326647 RepID=UPI0020C20072|nr:cytochrome P450 [Daldinia decipiens]KAI1653197.1 cytochrome P450 [Daldinia decipiens]
MEAIPVNTQITVVFIAFTTLLFLKLYTIGSRGKELPPGPKTIPILGNALGFPTYFPHIKFSEWARQYGEIYSLKVLNGTIIVLSSATAIKSVLDINGLNTGNRPESTIIRRVTNGNVQALEDMDRPAWRRSRKAMHTFITEYILGSHTQAQDDEYSQLMNDILEDPKNTFEHISRMAVGVLIITLYGSRVPKYWGSEAETYFRGVKLMNKVTDPGAHPPVDILWPLKYVPKRWAYWKRLADMTRETCAQVFGPLYKQCERAIELNKKTGCFIEYLIMNQQQLGMSHPEITGLAEGLMDAGAEATASFLQSIILVLINYPHVQEKGQIEIDSIVGGDRWPTLGDYDRCPYIRAIVEEIFRFRPVFPVGIPHRSAKETYYRGCRIPEDSIIFMNIYGLFHDPDLYDDPETFDPERFLKSPFGTKEGADTRAYRSNLAFGAGRRICAGEELARRLIAQNVMNLLWAFSFKKDGSGTGGMDIDSYSRPGIELAPKHFTCDITPRSSVKACAIKNRFEQAFPIHADRSTRGGT